LGAPQGAVIVGRYWSSAGAASHPCPCTPGSVTDRARALSREGWGAYLAFLHDRARDKWWIFRDPSGALEVFTWRAGDLAICASGLEDLPPGLRPARLGLDWRAIADCLRDPGALGGAPALAGIRSVTAGDLHPVRGEVRESLPIWRPGDWIPCGLNVGRGREADLATTLVRTIAAMVAPYDRVATEASGGLDSSIVNAMIGRAGLGDRVVTALHYVGDRPEADERQWAQALCERWDLPLACIERPRAAIDLHADFGPLARDIRPPLAALDSARDRDTAARLHASRAQALLTGKGGDALFFQMPTPFVLADLWRDHGLGAAHHPLNTQVARWLRRSVWSVWRQALSGRPSGPASSLGRFAGPALRETPAGPSHPWLADLDAAPPAKCIQIRALANGQVGQGANRRGQVADLLHPLQAQPMMELCLSIPTWELVRGGRDRALARDSFAAWLPASIAGRRSKGGLSSWYARHVAASASALGGYLLDGVLVGAGLLDRAEVEAALDPDDLILTGDGVSLLAAAAVEAWVRHWQTRVPDAAGAERPRA
jgi:asparagine synthase (glutamine-hydrolysing)